MNSLLAIAMLGALLGADNLPANMPKVYENTPHLDAIGKITGTKVLGRYEPTLNLVYIRNGFDRKDCNQQAILLHEIYHSLGANEQEAYELQHEWERNCD